MVPVSWRQLGYHNWMNHLLSSGNTTPELAGPLMCQRNGRWNIDAGVKNDEGTNFGMYQLRYVFCLVSMQSQTVVATAIVSHFAFADWEITCRAKC